MLGRNPFWPLGNATGQERFWTMVPLPNTSQFCSMVKPRQEPFLDYGNVTDSASLRRKMLKYVRKDRYMNNIVLVSISNFNSKCLHPADVAYFELKISFVKKNIVLLLLIY